MPESSYLTLKPAFTIKAEVELPRPIGALSDGTTKAFISVKSLSLTTCPGFTPALSASTLVTAGDWATTDPSGKFGRLDVRAVVQTDQGGLLNIEYTGLLTMSSATGKVFSGAADAATTEWGGIVVTPRLEGVRELEEKMWVGSGRFVVGEDGGTSVEYRISELVGCHE